MCGPLRTSTLAVFDLDGQDELVVIPSIVVDVRRRRMPQSSNPMRLTPSLFRCPSGSGATGFAGVTTYGIRPVQPHDKPDTRESCNPLESRGSFRFLRLTNPLTLLHCPRSPPILTIESTQLPDRPNPNHRPGPAKSAHHTAKTPDFAPKAAQSTPISPTRLAQRPTQIEGNERM